MKCVLDARHPTSNTDQFDESWPIEPLAPQLARANEKTNVQQTSCMPMHIQLWMKKRSHLVTNSLHFYDAFMVLKDFRISLQIKCQPSFKLLQNKVLLLFTLMIFYFYQSLKNICFNLQNSYIFSVQKTISNWLLRNLFS